MYLIAAELRTAETAEEAANSEEFSVGPYLCFLRAENSAAPEKPHALNTAAALASERVGNALAKHLITAANAEYGNSPCSKPSDSYFKAALTEPLHVGDSAFSSRDNDHVGSFKLLITADISHLYTVVLGKDVKVREV